MTAAEKSWRSERSLAIRCRAFPLTATAPTSRLVLVAVHHSAAAEVVPWGRRRQAVGGSKVDGARLRNAAHDFSELNTDYFQLVFSSHGESRWHPPAVRAGL